MHPLVKYTHASHLSNRDLMDILERIGDLGEIMFYKMDGERAQKRYTVVIASYDAPMSTIRTDSGTLQEGVQRVLKQYCELHNII